MHWGRAGRDCAISGSRLDLAFGGHPASGAAVGRWNAPSQSQQADQQ